MLMSAKKYKRNFIKNRYLYGKSADVSKPDGQSMKSVALMVHEILSIEGTRGPTSPPPGPVGLIYFIFVNFCFKILG